MTALRMGSVAIRRGDLRFDLEDDETLYAFERSYEDESYYLIANFSKEEREFPLDLSGYGKVVISNYGRETMEEHPVLRPYEVLILRKGNQE